MKKIMIILCTIAIMLGSTGCIYYVLKDSKKHIMYDGAVISMMYNGQPVDSIPNVANLHADIDCTNGAIGKYMPVITGTSGVERTYEKRLVFSNIPAEGTSCFISFEDVSDANDYVLWDYLSSMPTSVHHNYGYRYAGKGPHNWVWFNDELWRIIGAVSVCSEAWDAESGECGEHDQIKIIRAEPIGGYVWNTSTTINQWGAGNTLATLLNSSYYGRKNVSGAAPCYTNTSSASGTCDFTASGISNSSTDYYSRMIINEPFPSNTSSTLTTSATAPQIFQDEWATVPVVSESKRIGLMSLSDYVYATGNITYSSQTVAGLTSFEDYNWLFGYYYEWTMTHGGTSHYPFRITNTGTAGAVTPANGWHVRPVVYLSDSVYIMSGEGTETNPFNLGM